ncbi:MAG: pyridoxine 5'-phosphate synthase [Planctomycetes bacterium]|nr:pyridoxine 5'-phosphate synthase [Planctomycetota bacterium]
MIRLGVNIDHVATIRQARRTIEPDPVAAAALAELGGADGITVHLREDRRHIQDRDIELLRQTVKAPLNLEMAVAEEIVGIAVKLKPYCATLVPEKREEVTTEGGLDVAGGFQRVEEVTKRLQAAGIVVSLFIDPDVVQIDAAARTGAEFIELHTGAYAEAWGKEAEVGKQLALLADGVQCARAAGLRVNGGHGLTYFNVAPIAALPQIEDLNIGHSIISRAVFTGLERAVREMKEIMIRAWTEAHLPNSGS